MRKNKIKELPLVRNELCKILRSGELIMSTPRGVFGVMRITGQVFIEQTHYFYMESEYLFAN